MISYELIDHLQAKWLFKNGVKFQKIVAIMNSFWCFVTDIKYHNYKVIKRHFKDRSLLWKLYLTLKSYYYETFFIMNYGFVIYGKENSIRKICQKYKVKHLENLKEVMECKESTIIFTAHLSCFFLALMAIGQYFDDRPVVCLSPRAGQKRKDAVEATLRKHISNFEIVDITSKTCGLHIMRTFKKKGIVLCTMDYAYDYTRNIPVYFLGRQLNLPVGLVELGIKYEAVLIPVFSHWEGGNPCIEILEPFKLENGKEPGYEAGILQYLTNIIEEQVLKNPAQWTMWKSLW